MIEEDGMRLMCVMDKLPMKPVPRMILLLGVVVAAGAAFAQTYKFDSEKPAPVAEKIASEELQDIQYLKAHTKPNTPYRLDLSQPNQYRFVLETLKRVKETKESSPQLFRALEAAHDEGNAGEPKLAVERDANGPVAQDLNYISTFNLAVAPKTFSANGLSSVIGGTQRTTIVMELYSLENGQIYAADTATTNPSQFAQGKYFQLQVQGNVPAGLNNPTTQAQGMFAYIPIGSNKAIVSYYDSNNTVNPTDGCMLKPNYCVPNQSATRVQCTLPVQYQTTCTNKVTNTLPERVCYYRLSQQECDYYNPAPAQPTNFVFPLQGSATYPNTVYSPPQGFATITLENPSKGGGCYLVFQELAPLNPTYWSASQQTLSWNFAAASFPDPNKCLEVYDGTTTYLNVSGSVALQGSGVGPPPFGAFNFTSDRSQLGQPGIYVVPQIEIQKGCFAEGTKVRMADGSLRPIESFAGSHDEMIKGANGEARPVLATSTGIEPFPMIRLKTADGYELLVTRTHPIATPKGMVIASALKAGDQVRTEKGVAELSSVGEEKFSGKVYNVRLGSDEDAGANTSLIYANGILSGDLSTQHYYEKLEAEELNNDPRSIAQRLAPEWQEDYRNYLKTHNQ
jgi:hypothetical protein